MRPESYSVLNTVSALRAQENGGKPLVAEKELETRLCELTEGEEVSIVIFNCLDFDWEKNNNDTYPKSIIRTDTNTSIAGYFQEDILRIMEAFENLGNPKLNIIVPDSEIFDIRPFSFAQSLSERKEIADIVKSSLPNQLSIITQKYEEPVTFWSEYCSDNGLKTPYDYTTEANLMIKGKPELLKKVEEQAKKDSLKYFASKGSAEGIDPKEQLERTSWYLSMYAGEGRALKESRAIVINLEDGRVPAWFQRGADNSLPILTPVDFKKYSSWKKLKNGS